MNELADGKTTENEVLFNVMEIIDIRFKLFILTNFMINIDADQQAIYNRYLQITYCSNFDRTGTRTVAIPEELKFIADTNLANKLKKDYINEMLGLILEYGHNYYKSGIPKIPDLFLAGAKATKTNNDTFAQWFNDNCVVEIGSKIARDKLVEESEFSLKLIEAGMLRQGYKYNKDLSGLDKKLNGKYYKGGYEGCRLKTEEEKKEE
jgi:phage/plasmid-associated DNA primase